MNIVVNLQPILDFFNLPVDIMLWKLFFAIGWIPLAVTFIWGVTQVWLLAYIQVKWFRTHKFVFLAIDIPRGNMQSPKAVENIFAYLAGAHNTFDLWETWWEGQFQLSFSFEIVSIEGYIQFLVRTPTQWRNMVESAIYAQYPDAEITEVNDYTIGTPSNFPDEEYDIWGSEYILAKHFTLPIKIYEDFEHSFGKPEMQFKDPMAALMDLMSSLKKGEQAWFQLILIPTDTKWSDEGEVEIKKIIGEKIEAPKNIVDHVGDATLKLLEGFSEAVYQMWGDIKEKKEEKEQFKMMNLKPKQKKQVEAIQEKVGKLGYAFKIRYIYFAKKEVMNKPKVANAFTGYMKQFNTNDLNSFKPDTGAKGTMTKANYPLFKEYRLNLKKNRIWHNFKARDSWAGRSRKFLNTEELATIWHFPVETVAKAPLIQKAPGRKAEPPASLPFSQETVSIDSIFKEKSALNNADEIFSEIEEPEETEAEAESKKSDANIKKSGPPENLPFA